MSERALVFIVRAALIVRRTVMRIRRPERGQGLAEYALILTLISVLCIAGLLFISTDINTVLSYIGQTL